MLLEQIPHQRLNEVVKLPEKPANFQVNVDYDVPLKKQAQISESLYMFVVLSGHGRQYTTEWITTI